MFCLLIKSWIKIRINQKNKEILFASAYVSEDKKRLIYGEVLVCKFFGSSLKYPLTRHLERETNKRFMIVILIATEYVV